jgi:hypothetical protein
VDRKNGQLIGVADLVMFLASPAADAVNGTTLPADDGYIGFNSRPGETVHTSACIVGLIFMAMTVALASA